MGLCVAGKSGKYGYEAVQTLRKRGHLSREKYRESRESGIVFSRLLPGVFLCFSR